MILHPVHVHCACKKCIFSKVENTVRACVKVENTVKACVCTHHLPCRTPSIVPCARCVHFHTVPRCGVQRAYSLQYHEQRRAYSPQYHDATCIFACISSRRHLVPSFPPSCLPALPPQPAAGKEFLKGEYSLPSLLSKNANSRKGRRAFL